MKIGYIIAGFVFLFNPNINIIDILPDFIGYLLILKGLYKLSDLEKNIASARKKFKAAMWLSLVKFILVFASAIFDATWYLLLTFSFGILEAMYLIPAFIDLFYGISYLEERYTDHRSRYDAKPRFGGIFDKTEFASGTAYFELFSEKNDDDTPPFLTKNIFFQNGKETLYVADAGFASRVRETITYFYESAEARTMSVIFVIARAVCACLPQFTAIAGTGTGYVESNPITDYSGLREVLEVFLAVVSALIGIVWLVRMIRYFRVFSKDTAFLSVLEEKYRTEVLPNRGLWLKRKSLSFCTVATVAYAFMLCLRIDWFVIVPRFDMAEFFFDVQDLFGFFPIPEFLYGAVVIFAAFGAKDFAVNRRKLIRTSVFFMISSFAAHIAYFFLAFFYGGKLYPYQEAGYTELFALYMVFLAVSMVAFCLVSREKALVYRHIAEQITDFSCPASHAFSDRKRKEMMEDFGAKIKAHRILEAVYAVFTVLITFCLPFSEDYDICGLFWFFRLAFGAVVMIRSTLLSDAFQKEIEKIVE